MARVKNLMKGLKQADAVFFFWIYYPIVRHKKENICKFIEETIEKPKRLSSMALITALMELSTSFELEGYLHIGKPFHDDLTNTKVDVSIHGLATSAFPSGQTPYNPPFERKDMLSVFLADNNSCIDFEDPASIRGYLHYIDLFARHFSPVFGHGHKDLNKWVDTHNVSPPPETRVWPYNIYNLDAYESLLEDRLDDFIAVHGDEWSLRRIVENIVELRTKDLYTPESAIGSEVTRAILGEGDDLLVPKVGYPPPERWW